jgi:hypothetical protein
MEVEPPGADALRARLNELDSRLRDAIDEIGRAGFTRLSLAMTDSAQQIELMLGGGRLPATVTVEGAIARAQRALEIWRVLRGL